MKLKKNSLKNVILLVLTCLLCSLTTISCSYDKVASISVSGKSEILLGDFDYGDYTVEVTYESGEVKTVPLEKSMLSAEDNLKFFTEGEQTLTVNYLGNACEFGLKVCLYEFTDLRFDDVTAVYNGQYVTAEVFKNYPEGTEVYYLNGNSFRDAGTYSVTAIVSRRNYVTQELTANVTIEKAEYDMSGVTFKDCVFDYDGKTHTAEISGKLPDGVSVVYPDNNNKKVNAGSYTVTARFVSSNVNYKAIPDKTATMVINRKKYAAKDLAFEGSTVTYDGKEHSLKAENVPQGVNVTYSVEKQGNSGGEPVEGDAFANAGTYVYTAGFKSQDPNYDDIPSMTATLVIKEAKYDTSKITLESEEVDYDGKPHKIGLTEDSEALPDGAEKQEWYEKNGVIVLANDDEFAPPATEVTDCGTYEYTLKLYINANYEAVVLTAVLTINKIDYDVSAVSLKPAYKDKDGLIKTDAENVPEDLNGNKLGVKLYYFACDENGNYNECVKDADGEPAEGVTEAGEYRVLIEFTEQNNPNYNYLPPKTMPFGVKEIETGEETKSETESGTKTDTGTETKTETETGTGTD